MNPVSQSSEFFEPRTRLRILGISQRKPLQPRDFGHRVVRSACDFGQALDRHQILGVNLDHALERGPGVLEPAEVPVRARSYDVATQIVRVSTNSLFEHREGAVRVSGLAVGVGQASKHQALGLSPELFLEPANLVLGGLVERHPVLPDLQCGASAAPSRRLTEVRHHVSRVSNGREPVCWLPARRLAGRFGRLFSVRLEGRTRRGIPRLQTMTLESCAACSCARFGQIRNGS